ncbi:hypothetical protein CYMTET_12459 [Cymbomonas tetramitiformis]|uniref:Uncharacterized protein n=1 Tax=Cymbomonas tetramitiformis TaxID=36881 RepID=A0AAE0GKK2_9CHLO|nr:hypothetical protein CYMTET_12459 [Cymbomonas tetramitiformis]
MAEAEALPSEAAPPEESVATEAAAAEPAAAPAEDSAAPAKDAAPPATDTSEPQPDAVAPEMGEVSGAAGYELGNESSFGLERVSIDPAGPKRRAPPPRNQYRDGQVESNQRSQFGRQVASEKKSAPSFGFGTAPRFHSRAAATKQTISKRHSMHAPGAAMDNPGPGQYRHRSSVGKQEVSHCRSAGNFAFGTEVRFAEDNRREKSISAIPAPGNYFEKSGQGTQVQSTKPTSACFSFGSETRGTKVSIPKGCEEDMFGLESPGPAEYNFKSGIGKQTASAKFSSPTHVFGTDVRPIDPLVVNNHERRAMGLPGPGRYQHESSMAGQADSMRKSEPLYSFGTCDRERAGRASLDNVRALLHFRGLGVPGPGAHTTPVGAMQEQIKSDKKSNSKWTFTTEHRFALDRSTSLATPGPGLYRT